MHGAYLELVLQEVLLVRQLSIQAEKLGLLRRHFLRALSDLGRRSLRRCQRGSNASV